MEAENTDTNIIAIYDTVQPIPGYQHSEVTSYYIPTNEAADLICESVCATFTPFFSPGISRSAFIGSTDFTDPGEAWEGAFIGYNFGPIAYSTTAIETPQPPLARQNSMLNLLKGQTPPATTVTSTNSVMSNNWKDFVSGGMCIENCEIIRETYPAEQAWSFPYYSRLLQDVQNAENQWR